MNRLTLRFSTVFLLLAGLVSGPGFAQDRLVPHVTRATGGFSTQVLIANRSDKMQTYNLQPYAETGTMLPAVSGQIAPLATMSMTVNQLFGRDDVSHFTVADNGELAVSLAYRSTASQASPTHVQETTMTAHRWRIYPGDWQDVIDGLAVIQMGSDMAQIEVRQVDDQGMETNRITLEGSAAMRMKRLYLFETDFQNLDGHSFEIFSDQPLSVMALRFARADGCPAYFWENRAIPLPALAQNNSQVGKVAMLSNLGSYGVSGQATIVDEQTIRIDNFRYNGQGADVRFVLGTGGDYDAGFVISGKIDNGEPYEGVTLTYTLPAGRTLDDFDGISVWCTVLRSDFGSGIFQ